MHKTHKWQETAPVVDKWGYPDIIHLNFHRFAIWAWLLKPQRYEAEQCSFLLQDYM